MRILETVQTVKVRVRQPADTDLPLGKLSPWHIAQLRVKALRETEGNAKAQGAEVLEYIVHSAEVVEGK